MLDLRNAAVLFVEAKQECIHSGDELNKFFIGHSYLAIAESPRRFHVPVVYGALFLTLPRSKPLMESFYIKIVRAVLKSTLLPIRTFISRVKLIYIYNFIYILINWQV